MRKNQYTIILKFFFLKMLKKYLKLSFTAIGIFTSLFLQKVDAYSSPYNSAKAAYAINFCASEYGIFNDAASFNNINRYSVIFKCYLIDY